jgi:predicted DCC family thiol-disulfide oxidoreductase YuxK
MSGHTWTTSPTGQPFHDVKALHVQLVTSSAQDGRVTAVFLFDGDCGFCSACALFVERRITTRATVLPWQLADLAALGLTAAECDSAVQWVESTHRAAGPEAIAILLRESRWYWRGVGRVLGWRPVLVFAWPVYEWVSRNRHRMPGGTPACSLPAARRRRSDAVSVTDRARAALSKGPNLTV